MTLREKLAREVYRWSYGYTEKQAEYGWAQHWTVREQYRLEASRILKMEKGGGK